MEGRYSLKPKTGEADAAHCKEEKVAQVMKLTHREEEILQHRREVRVVDAGRSRERTRSDGDREDDNSHSKTTRCRKD